MELIKVPECLLQHNPMLVPTKILMGPGPSNPSERILRALSRPMLGHLHPETLKIMDDIKEGLRYVFQTKNAVTMCVSASGHGGMEMALCNLIEQNDRVLFGCTGLWGYRARDMAKRYGGDVRLVEAKSGFALTLLEIETALIAHKPAVLFITQGDSSTGVLQPLEGIGQLCRRYDCILVVDTVASLGGTEFYADKWLIDVVYTGSQKTLCAPPGITPITFNDRAMAKILARKTPILVYYWDVNLLGDYWGCFGRPRLYHHTGSATLLYGLREALAVLCEEGLPAFIRRHRQCAEHLKVGLRSIGLELFVTDDLIRLPTVTTVRVPSVIEDWKLVCDYLMKNHSIEMSGGLGSTVGLVFRIGLMGTNATIERVDQLILRLKEALQNTSNFQSKI